MKNEEPKIDKSEWGDGPWQTEPDRLEFEADGFPCLIVRNPSAGNLCGYVAVPPGHPWHGKDFAGNWDETQPSVHGGVTYSSACHGRICHVPKPGEPDNVWWIGFDCHHCDDWAPAYAKYQKGRTDGLFRQGSDIYRTVDYVRGECEALARQAKEASAA